MTDQERDAALLRIEQKVDEITTSLADKADKADVDAVSDGLQDLRRDLRNYGMLPEADHEHEATG